MNKNIFLLVFALSLLALPFGSATLLDDLEAYYSLDEGTGTTAFDSTGNDNDGLLEGDATWTSSGKIDGALNFNNGGYVDTTYIFNQVEDYSVGFWINLASQFTGNNQDIFGFIDLGNNNRLRLEGRSGGSLRIEERRNGNSALVSIDSFPTGWHYLTITSEKNGRFKVYLNSTEVGDVATTNNNLHTTFSTFIGNTNNAGSSYGIERIIDEVAIWKRAISPSEINSLYANGDGFNPYSVSQDFLVSVFDAVSGNPVNNTNVSFFLEPSGPITPLFNTSGHIVNATHLSPGLYTITASSNNFINGTKSFNWDGENGTTIRFDLFPANEVEFTFRDQQTNNIINNVTWQLNSNTYNDQGTTTNGTLKLDELPSEAYTLVYSSDGYGSYNYYFNVPLTELTQAKINLYLLNETISNDLVFTILDKETLNTIEGAGVFMFRTINNTKTMVGNAISDFSGRVLFPYEEQVRYDFVVMKDDYKLKEFILNPVIFQSYNVLLERSTTPQSGADFSGVGITFNPKTFNNNAQNNVTFNFMAPKCNLAVYGFTLKYKTTEIPVVGSGSCGASIQSSITISNATFGDRVEIYYFYRLVGSDDLKEFTYLADIGDKDASNLFSRRGETYGLGQLDRAMVAVGTVLLTAGPVTYFVNPIVGAVVGAFVFGFWVYMQFISIWMVIISLIVIFFYVAWRSTL